MCFHATVYECPKNGTGPAKLIRDLQHGENCAINCHGTQNPNACEIFITRSKQVQKDSFGALYQNGKLPKSHVPKTAA
jgi:hypothetical protein